MYGLEGYFKPVVVTKAINKIKRPGRLCLSTFFATQIRSLTAKIKVDLVEGTEGILPNIPADAPSTPTSRTKRAERIYMPTRIAPKRFIPLDELNEIRALGGEDAPELIRNRIARELLDMANEIDRTREYYANQAMTGKVLDIDGVELFDYLPLAEHTITLTSTDQWSDSDDSTPITDIRTWSGLIADAVGLDEVTRLVALASPDVIDALLNHKGFIDLVKTQIGVRLALEGTLERLGGVEIVEYRGFYKQPDGTKVRYVPSGYFRLGAVTRDRCEEIFAPPVKDVPGGLGSGQQAAIIAVDSEYKKDPAGWWLYAESRPLPAVHDAGVFVNAKVL